MRKVQNYNNLLKLLVSLVGMLGASILIGYPAGAQQPTGATNPRPSIFNEPPYNRSRTPAPTPGAEPTTPSEPSPQTEPTTPAPAPGTAPTTPAPAPGASQPSNENVVALAASNDSFKTLTAALKAAGLTETLSGKGPFTIFAPTDAAFAALPQDALQELLKPENKDILVKILSYHVVPGNVTSGDIKSGEVKTVEGAPVNVQVDSAKAVTLNNEAKVVQPDLKASNGVIHAIDKVMLPPDL